MRNKRERKKDHSRKPPHHLSLHSTVRPFSALSIANSITLIPILDSSAFTTTSFSPLIAATTSL
jgi:hypothetical protein